MLEELGFLLNTFVAVFVIIDPFAVVPVYLTLSERFSAEERKSTCLKSTVVAFGILFVFAVSGLQLFKFFGISLPAFQIAGGLLILIFGISQLNRKRDRLPENEQEEVALKDDISIFPIATPLLAGPGAISTVVLFSSEAKSGIRIAGLVTAIFFVLIVTYAFLRLAPKVFHIFGQTGLNLLTRIMGIILSAIAVQFIINGIKTAFSL